MIVADLVKISAKMMEMLSKHGIDMSDYQYIDLYDEYLEMVSNGDKVTYVVTYLAEKYKTSERSIYRLLKRFNSPAN